MKSFVAAQLSSADNNSQRLEVDSIENNTAHATSKRNTTDASQRIFATGTCQTLAEACSRIEQYMRRHPIQMPAIVVRIGRRETAMCWRTRCDWNGTFRHLLRIISNVRRTLTWTWLRRRIREHTIRSDMMWDLLSSSQLCEWQSADRKRSFFFSSPFNFECVITFSMLIMRYLLGTRATSTLGFSLFTRQCSDNTLGRP